MINNEEMRVCSERKVKFDFDFVPLYFFFFHCYCVQLNSLFVVSGEFGSPDDFFCMTRDDGLVSYGLPYLVQCCMHEKGRKSWYVVLGSKE